MAAQFDFKDFTEFVANYSVINGELIDEFGINLSPQRLKKELNHMYNIINILNGNNILAWNPVEDYIIGELVQNQTADDKYYRAKKVSSNKRPDLFTNEWEVATHTDYTEWGDFTNFLAKDNEEPYSPISQYNPATKGYVDFQDTKKLDLFGKAADSSLLNGEKVTNVMGSSTTKPASQKLVQTVDNKADTKLDASEFNATNIMTMVQSVDGEFSGLDADYLGGQSSEFFMKVGTTSNFDTMLTPGSYLISPGAVGAPNTTGTFTMVVSGSGNYYNQIATAVTTNKLYYRSYVGTWSAWKEFASATGSVATADKLSSPVTISISGDVSGTTSFDGSQNVNIVSSVLNDSHTHDGRYYTEVETDATFLTKTAKAADSELLDGLNSTQYLRSDVDDIFEGNLDVNGELNVDGDFYSGGAVTVLGSLITQIVSNNVELGADTLPTETTANLGGFTLLGATNKYIRWEQADNAWHFNPNNIVSNLTGTASNANLLDGHDSTYFAPQVSTYTKVEVDNAIAPKIQSTDYAAPTVGGTLKARFDAATGTLYLTNDGTDA